MSSVGHERAAAILGFTNAHYADDAPRQRTEQSGYERLMQVLSQTYDEGELAQRMSAGSRLNEGQVLELATAIGHSTEGARSAPPAGHRPSA